MQSPIRNAIANPKCNPQSPINNAIVSLQSAIDSVLCQSLNLQPMRDNVQLRWCSGQTQEVLSTFRLDRSGTRAKESQ